MKPTQIVKVLNHMVAVRQPVMLWGPPGVGKSRLVEQVANAYGDFIDMRLPQFDAVDLRGIPVAKNGTTQWITPSTFPRSGKGILFLDELVQAVPIVQSAASQLILDRRIGEYTLPDGWAVIAAGNRETDRASTNRMPSHISNRFTHINFDVDVGDWTAWAFEHNINPMVIGFVNFRPALLHNFDPKQKANATPRSWEFVSEKILINDDLDDCLMEVIAGTVGEAAAVEFLGFVRTFRELPDYDAILKNPTSEAVPQNAAARYAVASMLTTRTQPREMGQVMKYVERMPAEFQMLTVPGMAKKNPKLAETSAYIGWIGRNKDLLLNATVR